ncbi:MAG: hypothetical protein GXP45_02735 [bacterium]|nr:hypothetical protein [bacterium]
MKETSIEQLKAPLEEARLAGRISTDDYKFYQALFRLRYRDYDGAYKLLNQIKVPRYASFIQEMNSISTQIKKERDVPSYYKDSLIALKLLKN